MNRLYKFIFAIAMMFLGVVSMWTTYVSLHDSILPKPTITIPVHGIMWECSIFALLLSVAIGMMLFALKMAIIGEHKQLTILGVLGLTIVGFVSIAFNLDVLYRTADRDFYLSYSNQQMRSSYDQYLGEILRKLGEKQMELRKIVARQEGEMEAEVKGLRQAPAGYGPIAKQEDYKLTLMVKQAQVELDGIDQTLKTNKDKVDQLLATRNPTTIDEVQQLQTDLRVALKDLGAAAGMPLPKPIQADSPLFAVFDRLFNTKTVGLKEVFFLILAFLLDLGDICGYVLVSNKKPARDLAVTPSGKPVSLRPGIPVFRTPELLPHPPTSDASPRYGVAYDPDDDYPADYRPSRERIIRPPAEQA